MSKKITHTPGEWAIARNGIEDKYKYSILSNGSKAICDVYRHNWPNKKSAIDKKALANAKLIAAAPELLAALQESVKAMKIITSYAIRPFIEEAEAAIKKAID